jgi:hypothetical protein
VATLKKKYNNLLTYLVTSMMQGIKAKLHPRQAFTTLPLSISGRRSTMAARRRDRPDRYHHDDDNNRFPAFTSNITTKSYTKDFKRVGIPKFDGKQDPCQWIRCYSIAI